MLKFVYVALATFALYGLMMLWASTAKTLVTVADFDFSIRGVVCIVFFLAGLFLSWK